MCYTFCMKRNYELVCATETDFDFVKEAKLKSIFDYAKNISEKERNDILSYVERFTNKFLKDYKIVVVDCVKCGVFFVRDFEDGVLLDEIFLLPEYRNMGIGSDLIKKELYKHQRVYLWVYKANVRAVSLYKKLGFTIREERGERLLMMYDQAEYDQ